MSQGLPAHCHRLFAHYAKPSELSERAPSFVISRLLEDGESQDLRWLTARFPERALARWLAASGARQLSHRSRSFWDIVLAPASAPAKRARGELWPL